MGFERDILKRNNFVIDKAKEVLDSIYASNEEFNDYLNNNEIINKDYSEILFYTDIESYLDELDNWKENKIREDYVDLLSSLGPEGKNTLSELAQSIQRKRIAPFIGAGLCAPLQFPSWGDALKEIQAKFDDLPLPEVEDLIEKKDYLKAAELLYNQDKRTFMNYVSDRFVLKPGYTKKDVLIGALQYLPEIAHGCVITTNFDKTLEKVFDSANKSFQGFMYGIQPRSTFVKDLIKGERCLLKLHGNVGEEDSYIFTLEQYNEAYGNPLAFEKPLPKTLRQVYISHSLLFIGCSLEKDKTLELFQKIKEDGDFEIPQHYAILPKPSENALRREKENYLREVNIKTIWYSNNDGEHAEVEMILKLAVDLANNKNTNVLKS